MAGIDVDAAMNIGEDYEFDTYMKQIMEKLLLLIPLNEPRPFPWENDLHPFFRFELTFTKPDEDEYIDDVDDKYTITLEGQVGDDRNYDSENGYIGVLDIYDEIEKTTEEQYIRQDFTKEEYEKVLGYLEGAVYESHRIEGNEDEYHDFGLFGGGRGAATFITCTAEGYLFKTVALS